MSKLKHVAAGVRVDVEKLLNKFVATEDICFEEFSRLWREMKFSLIFMGRPNMRERIEFIAECFQIAMSYWNDENSFELQVGSFFLLYGFYMKQPCLIKQKIRVRSEDWKNLKQVIKKCEEKEMQDVSYIYQLFWKNNAFNFVCRATLFGPRTSVVYNDVLDTDKQSDNVMYGAKSLLMKRELPHLASLHDQYQEAKKDLPSSMSKTLNMVKENVSNKAITNIKRFLAKKNVSVSDNTEESENECDNDDESPVDSDVGARRAVLKDKVFRARPTSTRARRHRVVVSDESDVSPRKRRNRAKPI